MFNVSNDGSAKRMEKHYFALPEKTDQCLDKK